MYFLDTHIVVWLYQKSLDRLSKKAIESIDHHDIFISPIVLLELEYLFEIGRIKDNIETIVQYLKPRIGLKIDNEYFQEIINVAVKESWTRDPFDRLIVAHARYKDAYLISKDENIAKNYAKTIS
jgi:PIN domain nuclease of toxin-antitoxin system